MTDSTATAVPLLGEDADFDLTPFQDAFFEEAGENLEQMERLLLAIDPAAAQDQALNAIFRCAHSIKGGAATFGFADVAALTHHMETLLDKLRRHELSAHPSMVDLLLRAGDALKALLSRHRGMAIDAVDSNALVREIGRLAEGHPLPSATPAAAKARLDPALHPQLVAGLADLRRNTCDLQPSVIAMRTMAMSAVFNRFARMLRELAAQLGKQVDFVTHGEATELDKGMIEKITDALTHLVRNSCDHGIERPADRLAKGKSESGTLTLTASRQGGDIVIEVRDDGRGLSRDKLLRKAREKGLAAPDTLSDAAVWSLIFAPGFSTADEVTEVSGRGVGMDVVKTNITALGGTVEIDAAEGHGMSVKLRLPLSGPR